MFLLRQSLLFLVNDNTTIPTTKQDNSTLTTTTVYSTTVTFIGKYSYLRILYSPFFLDTNTTMKTNKPKVIYTTFTTTTIYTTTPVIPTIPPPDKGNYE